MDIIIDTNFLFIPFTLKVDIFSQLREEGSGSNILHIIDKQIEELEYLMKRGTGKEKSTSKMVISSIKTLKIDIIPTEESFKKVDERILETAVKMKFGVATQDKELKQKLKKEKVPVYYLRQKKYIMRD